MRIFNNSGISYFIGSRSSICQIGVAYPFRSAMKKIVSFLPGFVLGVLLMGATSVHAANHYVRAGATGSNNGLDWTNAYTSLPSSLVRGDTYYIADGTYSGRTLGTANSGTATITIKKATGSNHGTDTGWSSTYGDGQATFGEILLGSDYWVIDGQTRDESSWSAGNTYGFRISQITASTAVFPGMCSSNLTVRYANIGGGDVGNTYSGSEPNAGFYIGGFDESCTNWTLQRNFVHNTIVAFHMNGTDTGTIEYNWVANSFGKEAIRGQVRFSNYVIRHNVFKDACQKDPTDPTSGCTAEIALWDGSNFSGNQIYGNLIYKTTANEVNSGGAIIVGGNGSSWVGPSASNTLVYNNTIAGLQNMAGGTIIINGGSGNVCRNNLWYDCIGTPSCTANTTSDNAEESSSPFLNYAGKDFRLSRAIGGYSLPSPYNMDMLAIIRGTDGVWDRGAFEFQSGSTPSLVPNPPKAIQIQ